MSDKEVTIHFKTSADVAGVKATKEAIEEVNEELEELEEKTQEAAQEVEDTLDIAGKSATKEAIEEVNEELEELEENAAAAEEVVEDTLDIAGKSATKEAVEEVSEELETLEKKTKSAASGVENTLETAGKRAAKTGEQVANAGEKGARGFQKLGQGALNAAYFIDDMQYGIKGVMNNIPSLVLSLGGGAGLAGALSIAAVGFSKLYEWMSKDAKAAEDLAKANKEAADTLIKAGAEARKGIANEEAYKRVLELNKEVNKQRRISLNLIRETAEEERRQILMSSKVLDAHDKKKLAQVELTYMRGGYGAVGSMEAQQRRAEAEAWILEDTERRKREEALRMAEVGLKEAEGNYDLREERYREALREDKKFRDKRAMSPDDYKVAKGNIEELTNRLAEHLAGISIANRSEIGRFFGHLGLNRQTSADIRVDSANLAKTLIADYVDPYSGKTNTFGRDAATAKIMQDIAKEMHKVQMLRDLLKETGFSEDEEGLAKFLAAGEESEKNKLEALGKRAEATQALEKAMDVYNMQKEVNKYEEATSQIKQDTREEKHNAARRDAEEKAESREKEESLRREIETLKQELKRLEKEQGAEKAFELGTRGKGWGRGKTNAMVEVGEKMAKSVKSAMEDGRVDEREAKELLEGFRSAMEQQGMGYNEKGGKSFLREVIGVMQQFAAQQQTVRASLDKAMKDLEQLKNQSKNGRW